MVRPKKVDPDEAKAIKLNKQRERRAESKHARHAAKAYASAYASGLLVIDDDDVIVRWNQVQREQELATSKEVAIFLLDRYR